MAIEQIEVEDFLSLALDNPLFDVRSPGEFSHAHIPGALSLPLFTDEQRKIIGTAYKQESRQKAVDIGLEYFAERMKTVAPEVNEIIKQRSGLMKNGQTKEPAILLHCWRGGMRSGAVAWLLNLYGYRVYTLKGGYKAFRNWVMAQFEKSYRVHILGGYTGSGKTVLLKEMKKRGNLVIDLEGLANHKGSAFGALGENPQPGQEMFENLLAIELYKENTSAQKEIWVEDESRHIGTVGIPNKFWEQMRKSPLYFLEIPFEERLKHIISVYAKFEQEELKKAILKIQKRVGGLETKRAIQFLLDGNIPECFSILLTYYDKLYGASLHKRENIKDILNKIPFPTVDINNAQRFCNQNA